LCELIRRDFWRHPAVRYSYAGVFSTNGRPSKTPRRPRFVANFDFDKVLS